jgi:hypothetical protein
MRGPIWLTVGEKVCSLADEEESAASHPIPRNSWPSCENCRPRDGAPMERRGWGVGLAFPRKKACNHFLPRRPLVALAAQGEQQPPSTGVQRI